MSAVDEQRGRSFRIARRRSGMTLQQVSDRLEADGHHLTISSLSKIERGRQRITLDVALALASAYGCTLDALLALGAVPPPMVWRDSVQPDEATR